MDKEVLGLSTLQWKPLNPINNELIRPGQPLKEGISKNKFEITDIVVAAASRRQL